MIGEIISVFLLFVIVFALYPIRKLYLPLQSSEKVSFFTLNRIEYFDFLKGVAILAVILVHIAYISLKTFAGVDTLFLFTLNNLNRFAIPFFLIISGILSTLKYEKKISLKHYYFGKFYKIYLPFVFFTVLAIFLHGKDIGDLGLYLVSGKVLTPYYFVILILQFYILFPFIKHFKDSRIFLFVSFLISLLFFTFNDLNTIYEIIIFPKFLFFFVYGMYYRYNFINYKSEQSQAKYCYFIIFLYIFISLVIPAHYFNFRPFYGLAVFNLLFIYKNNIITQLDNAYKLICQAGENSLWIYLTHFSILSGLFYLIGLITNNLYATVLIVLAMSIPISFVTGEILALLYQKILKLFYATKNTK